MKKITALDQYSNTMETKDITFYKDPDTRWYVDLPDWTGTKADLEMVMGADTMLEYMSEGEDKVRTSITLEESPGYDKLTLVEETPDAGGGYYLLDYYRGHNINLKMWLCDVTRYVFDGKLPKEIYIVKT